ncbi:MAG: hypothetical protein OQK24_13195 [Magnetovibrio sp.]|nr:hypothetical protein [Magnetovibrio sp.]
MVDDTDDDDRVPFENEPSKLDSLTHEELRLMHREASQAILFAKSMQWCSVGAVLLAFGACIAVDASLRPNSLIERLLSGLTIVLACGIIFMLLMYQFWQFNEITRIRKIEEHFSSLYRHINNFKSSREGNAHRYTMLIFMIALIIIGGVVTNIIFSAL